jgi:sec-independent protein translocase protein TatA
MMGAGSFGHWAIVLLVMILLFGAGSVPKLMADLGKACKALKTGLNDEGGGRSSFAGTGPTPLATPLALPQSQPSGTDPRLGVSMQGRHA